MRVPHFPVSAQPPRRAELLAVVLLLSGCPPTASRRLKRGFPCLALTLNVVLSISLSVERPGC